MNTVTLHALRWIAAATLASLALVHAQEASARPDTTSAAARQSAAAERHVVQSLSVVHQLDMDDRMRSLLAAAKGIFIVPSYARAAIGLGAEGGAGLLLLRTAGGGWSQPVFYDTAGLSLGLQVGAQGGMLAFVLNNQKAVDAFMKKTSIALSAKAGLTVVNWNRMVQGVAGRGDVVAWADSRGVFGDAATVELSGVRYNQNLNNAYYHRTLSASDILEGKTSNPQANLLVQALTDSAAAH